jgi:hypothetical protein
MKIFFVLSAVIGAASALPLSTISSVVQKPKHNTLFPEERMTEQRISDEGFMVQVDRLAQVIATHIQFDHLDAVVSSTDEAIATEFQHHIQISVQSTDDMSELMSHGTNQYTIQQLPTMDMLDLEILKSQIFAAIQAHTEGNLPLTWDEFAEKLSQQAIEAYVRRSLLEYCGNDNQDTISSKCLDSNAVILADKLDDYISRELGNVFESLDRFALPDLLQHTAKDLEGILHYFNSVFLQNDNRKFKLEIVPWNENEEDNVHSFKSRLLEIAVHPQSDENVTHSTAFFKEYAPMARV